MPRGDKSSYTGKQKRKAEHIEEGYERRGVGHKEAERRAWATVNKGKRRRQKERFRAGSPGHNDIGQEGRPAWRCRIRRAPRRGPVGVGEEGGADQKKTQFLVWWL
jgi:hypothetical protein